MIRIALTDDPYKDPLIVRVHAARVADTAPPKYIDDVTQVRFMNGIYLVDHLQGENVITSTFNSIRFELDII